MTYPNPRYDPDWEAVHDRHAAGRERAAAEEKRLIVAGAMATDAC